MNQQQPQGVPVRPQKTNDKDFMDVSPLEPDVGSAGVERSNGEGHADAEEAPGTDGAAAAQDEPGVQSAEPRR